MSRALETGAKIEAKRAPGLQNPWLSATFVRYEGRKAIVRFKHKQEEVEVEAHAVREPKARVVRRPVRAISPPPAPEDRPKIDIILDCVRCGDRPGGHAPPWGGNPSLCAECLPLAVSEGPPAPMPQLVFSQAAQPRAVERSDPPEKCETWLEACRRDPCANCGAPPRNDPHHEDTPIRQRKRGVRQKCRDTLAVPLCRTCHHWLTDTDCLPSPADSERKGKIVLRSRVEALDVLRQAQENRLREAVDRLPQEWRIEVLSKAQALVPEAVLRQVLLGEGP